MSSPLMPAPLIRAAALTGFKSRRLVARSTGMAVRSFVQVMLLTPCFQTQHEPSSTDPPCQTIIKTVSTISTAGSITSGWGCPVHRASFGWAGCGGCLKRMGDPHLGLRIIHVAGTKGKGSTSAMIAAALSASGVRTGLYCSPHLHRLEERFTCRRQAGLAVRADRSGRCGQRGGRAARARRQPRRSSRPYVLRDHHGDGAPALRPPPGRRRRARGRPGRPARLDECRSAGPLGHHQHLVRSHPATGQYPGGDRHRKGGDPQARPPGNQRRRATRGERRRSARVARQRRCSLREIDKDFWYEDIPPVPPLIAPDRRPASPSRPGAATGDD